MNWRCGGAARGLSWVVAVSKALTGVARAEAIVVVVVVVVWWWSWWKRDGGATAC